MINLLPPDVKTTYRYARHNRTLARWITACAFSLLGGLLLAGGGYVYLNRSIDSTNQQIAFTNRQLKAQNLTAVQKQVTTISNNLKLTVQVLSQEILFSKLLKQLASVTPNNAILTNLAITQTQGGVDITAQTANYNAATQLQINLADPKNQIFSRADIVSISCSSTSSSNTKYPCTVILRALFATNNPFLFINDQKRTAAK
ncbi:MAG TPA: PilN domain-containing protein [Candidatus Saccharimonadales bacterium]|nr:PilN domain-containing protein [Candidatus Saccharimonadales bacterium]